MKIGFVGLGIMGSRMAANLAKQRHVLVLYNRTRAKADTLAGPCVTIADSPAEAAKEVAVLFTMLAHPDAVEEAALGDNGFLDHLQPGYGRTHAHLCAPHGGARCAHLPVHLLARRRR